MDRQRQTIRWGGALLLLLTAGLFPPAPAAAEAPRGARTVSISYRAVLARFDWLNQNGVDVRYPVVFTEDPAFAAIELPQRLYAERLGYPADWGVLSGEEMQQRVQAGWYDLTFVAQGGGSAPQVGDIVVWPNDAAVVNQVFAGSVEVVQQGRWSSRDASGTPLPRSTLVMTRTGTGGFSLEHNPLGWIHSPRVAALYDGLALPLAIAGDWDGDGRDGVGLFFPATRRFYLKNEHISGPPDVIFSYGDASRIWLPAAGDWDGDGVDTVALYNQEESLFVLFERNAADSATLSFVYGTPNAGLLPLAGDWNDDGADMVGVYEPQSQTFSLGSSIGETSSQFVFAYGPLREHWLPVIGDWDGFRSDTAGLYETSESAFYLSNRNAASQPAMSFGYGEAAPTNQPIVGDWDNNESDTVGLSTVEVGTSELFYWFQLRNQSSPGAPDVSFRLDLHHYGIFPLCLNQARMFDAAAAAQPWNGVPPEPAPTQTTTVTLTVGSGPTRHMPR